MKSASTSVKAPPGQVKQVPVSELLYDSKNPRLVEAGAAESQKEILRILWREFAVDEIALSIAANGYFPYEPLFATKEDGKLVVVEGNRRLAAVRLLVDADLRRDVGATDLPPISASAKKALDTLPVVICSRSEIWQYVGFKHVNGPQQWQSYSKARYIAWVRNDLKVPLDEIAQQIGDQHSTVKRLYREGSDSFEESPWMRGSVTYVTPPLVENTEVAGPIALKLYAATTDTDVHWIITLYEIDPQGNQRQLTKGWLRGSHRELDLKKSKPWEPVHTHAKSEPLTPGKIYEFDIKLIATGNLFKAGTRIGLKISCVDDEPKNPLELIASGSIRRTAVARVTVFHNEDYPSYLLLPITKGNVLNTFFSGGVFPG